MSLPLPESHDPKQAAVGTMSVGRLHDVVVGASKLLHGADPDENDTVALHWALDLLDSAASTDLLFTMPSTQQLATGGGTVLAIRRAAHTAESEVALDRVRDGLEAALNGQRNDEVTKSIAGLRMLFAIVSRISLHAEVLSAGEREMSPWPSRSTRNSLS